jgi:diguanylate cyclase (GGDEF)-like protein
MRLGQLFKLNFSRRMAAVIAIALLAIMATTFWVAAAAIDGDLDRNADARAVELGGNIATNLNFRLLTLDSIIENAAAGDGTVGAKLIEQRLRRFAPIRSVVVESWTHVFVDRNIAPVNLSAADRQLLKSAKSKLVSQVVNDEVRALYVVRVMKIGGTVAVLFCEIDQSWLWQGIAPARVDSAVAVLDHEGRVLQSTATVPAELLPMLQAEKLPPQQAQVPVTRNWSDNREQWRGVVAQVQVDGAEMVTDRWSVICYRPMRLQSAGYGWLAEALPLLALVAVALTLLAVLYLRGVWEPVLESLRRALHDLNEGRYTHVPLAASADVPRQVAAEYNKAVTALQRRMQALASLNEIDRLLLQPGQIEQSLDHLLQRICSIAACHSVALALLDPDAQGYARAYAVTTEGQEQPVNRIAISPAVVTEISEQISGLTVINSGGGRYGFLDPLRALGAEFFWVWPVLADTRVVAILSVGYLGVPEVPPELASFGSECAARLGVALSNSARDEELYRQAHFDALTGLPNRLLFRDRLAQELAGAGSGPLRGALLYIDLDQFKKVNDTVGHAGGDQLLQIVAQRLRACVKEGDTVARLSGDEFTVVLRSVGTPESARATANRIVEALQMPVAIAGRDHFVRASVGVTMFPDDGSSIEELTRNADLAMYQAKEGGRGRVVFYARAMDGGQAPVVESSLLRAMRKQEFLLHYQPQYSLSDGSLVGVEALVRWQPPRQPLRYPGEFIALAEESGLIIELGAWVIETACAQLAAWRKQGIAPPRLSINVSVNQLRQADFPTQVRRVITKAQLPPECIELEITESVFADDEAREALQRLAAVGVRLALDDFGTGYSSLGFLREHPVQAIKIDRSFVEDVVVSPTAATLAETIISMAHALGKQVVAEGVETLEQLEFLRRRHCDLAQGYFFSKPHDVAGITDILSARSMLGSEVIRSAG